MEPSLLLVGIILGTSIAVLIDAKRMGVRPNTLPGFFASGSWGWFFGCLFVWIVVFPLYLFARPKLHAALAAKGVVKDKFGGSFQTVGVLSILAVAGLMVMTLKTSPLPDCTNTQVIDVAKGAAHQITDRLNARGMNAQVKALINISKAGEDPSSGAKVCRATLVTNYGEDRVQFTITKAPPRSGGTFLVEIELVNASVAQAEGSSRAPQANAQERTANNANSPDGAQEPVVESSASGHAWAVNMNSLECQAIEFSIDQFAAALHAKNKNCRAFKKATYTAVACTNPSFATFLTDSKDQCVKIIPDVRNFINNK